jgi:hypothetical protein
MKVAEVNKSEIDSAYPSLQEISEMLDKQNSRLKIDILNWNGYEYRPQVELAMAYSDNEIYIKYYVRENYFKAEMTKTNQMVCEDSCVEFFVSPEDDGIYYNIEFNGIGTCLIGSGTGRASSARADPGIVSKIRRITSVGTEPVAEITGDFQWSLIAAIPYEIFFRHKVKDLKGKTFRANFYKCGDKLKVPHYVTWNPVGTENPDYHQPQYFGMLKFI